MIFAKWHGQWYHYQISINYYLLMIVFLMQSTHHYMYKFMNFDLHYPN